MGSFQSKPMHRFLQNFKTEEKLNLISFGELSGDRCDCNISDFHEF